ncbi:MAG: hypothetical protein ACXAAH_08760, partial [Promethearchaeota archaeon]
DSGNNIIMHIGKKFSTQYLIKINSTGSTIWYKEWGDNYMSGNSKVTLNDNILISNITFYQNNYTVDIWVMKINGSGITINKTKIGNYLIWQHGEFWGDIGYFDNFNNTYFMLRTWYDSFFLVKINSNLTITWNYSMNDYPKYGYLDSKIKCDSLQNTFLFPSRSNEMTNNKILFVKLNSSGRIIHTFLWGGYDIEYIRGFIDTQNNFYFICISEMISRWNDHIYYIVLVKNPQANGFPPELILGVDNRDWLVINIMIFASLISLGIVLSIIIPELKVSSNKFNRNKSN